jgi:hypothetical protein
VRVQDSKWYKSRPPYVKQKIDAYPPNKFYRLKSTGQIAWIASYEEREKGQCTTCKVNVTRRYNPEVITERTVFGVPFEDLEEIAEGEEYVR